MGEKTTREQITEILQGTGITPKDVQEWLGDEAKDRSLSRKRALSSGADFTLGDYWREESARTGELVLRPINGAGKLDLHDARLRRITGESSLPGEPAREEIVLASRYRTGRNIPLNQVEELYGSLAQVIYTGPESFIPVSATWRGVQERLSGAQQSNFRLDEIAFFDRGKPYAFLRSQALVRRARKEVERAHAQGKRILDVAGLIHPLQDVSALLRPEDAGLQPVRINLFNSDGTLRTGNIEFEHGLLRVDEQARTTSSRVARISLYPNNREPNNSPFTVLAPVETRPSR